MVLLKSKKYKTQEMRSVVVEVGIVVFVINGVESRKCSRLSSFAKNSM